MALRTRFIDDEVLRAMSVGVTQFVLIGAGYDGRALRFRQPGETWFEIDHPATQPDKQRRVRRAAKDVSDIRYAAVDLLRDDVRTALKESGHDAGRPSLFICEGLFSYLPNEVVESLCGRLRDVAASASVVVASTLVVPEAHQGKPQAVVDSVLRMLGERRMGIFHPGAVESTLADTGWTVCRRATSRAGRLVAATSCSSPPKREAGLNEMGNNAGTTARGVVHRPQVLRRYSTRKRDTPVICGKYPGIRRWSALRAHITEVNGAPDSSRGACAPGDRNLTRASVHVECGAQTNLCSTAWGR
jgi:methyltransferase (TIGR00027 family)